MLLSSLLVMGTLSSVMAEPTEALGLPVLLSITVAPPVASIGVGQTVQFTATGLYADLSTKNLTDSVTWSTSKKATATVSAQGLGTAVGTGVVTITATDPATKIAGTAALTVTPAVLLAIAVTPPVASIGVGQTQQFTATGTYSDLSTQNLTDSVTWSSSSTSTATISSQGLATGAATGVIAITATDPSSGIPGTAALTVTPAVLVAIAVSPPVEALAVGQTEQFTATGTYSDLSTQNLTDSVTWSSSSMKTATLSSSGLATGVATGVATVTATDPSSGIPGTAALTVTPAVLVAIAVSPPVEALAVGQTEQFTATGTYSDLSTQNLTDSVTWSSSSMKTATLSSSGLATGVATGVATVTATDPSSGIPGTAALTVTPAVLVAIAVSPPVEALAVGQTERFTATGTYSDLSTKNLTNKVTWSSSSTSTATVSSTGLATGVATGAVTVTATDPSSGIPGVAALTVTPAVLLAITVSPPVASLGVDQTEQFTATGTYSDLSTKNLTDSVTWTSSSTSTATVTSKGLATGVATGAVTVTATDPSSGIPGVAALTVTPAVLLAITVSPPVASLGVDQTEQFTATGTYSDLSTKNLTDSVTWTSSSTSTATVTSKGLATGVATGAVTVTATDPSSGIPGVAALTVTPAVLMAITVSPPAATIGIGGTEQFTATGLYSDLSTKNLTDSVTWSSSSTSTATVSAAGLATGVGAGAVVITATDPSTPIPGTAALTVGITLAALTMTPTSGKKRTTASFTGVGFTPGLTATVTYLSGRKRPKRAKTVLCTATVAFDGTFSCSGVIPRRGKAGAKGQKTITGTDPTGTQATTTFTLQ